LVGGNILKKIFRIIDEHLEGYIMGMLLIGISCIMFLQIIMRVIGSSLSWAEELSRYFYVYSVFLSLSYTVRNSTVLKVELLLDLLPKKVKKSIQILLQMLNAVFFFFMSYYSVLVVSGVKISSQTSPALELPMYIIYLIIPISFILTSLRSIEQIYFIITGKSETNTNEIDFSEL